MQCLGVPVPPAFVLTTDECARFDAASGRIPDDVLDALPTAMRQLEAATGRTFGAGPAPLLVSVRSGAATSMPGMMDTVLNLGMTPAVEAAIAAEFQDPRFAIDTHGRFVLQYRDIVGAQPPADPWEQLYAAIAAVFASWRSPRAQAYRAERGIDGNGPGTAVTVQAMVFGNRDTDSGSGVLFTSDPRTGAPEPFGEWLPHAQGEDVVSGRHDPLSIDALRDRAPSVHAELLDYAKRLEQDAGMPQDIEFTIETGRLWLLQARAAKIAAGASATATHVEARDDAELLAQGRPAAPGVVTGLVVVDPDDAEDRALAGESIVLARPTTSPDDVRAMAAVAAVLTEIGGSTSHAAVVSRELGTPCVVGCGTDTVTRLDGRRVTVDAHAGDVYSAG